MSSSRYEPLEGMVGELIRRGLPVEYAQHATSELADHHRDLVEELQEAGWTEAHADLEASRRLGERRVLMKKTVREFQCRYWCGRWPLITFLVGPIPALIAIWFAAGLALWLVIGLLTKLGLATSADIDSAMMGVPVGVKYAFLAGLFLVIPGVVMFLFARLARRAALGGQWIILVACILGMFVGAWKWERIGPDSRITMYDRQSSRSLEQPPKPDFILKLWLPINARSLSWPEFHRFFLSNPIHPCQMLLPAVIAGCFLIRGVQLSSQRQRAAAAGG